MYFFSTLRMFFVASYRDWKNGESFSRVYRKSYARYKKHGRVGMLERLKKEYNQPKLPFSSAAVIVHNGEQNLSCPNLGGIAADGVTVHNGEQNLSCPNLQQLLEDYQQLPKSNITHNKRIQWQLLEDYQQLPKSSEVQTIETAINANDEDSKEDNTEQRLLKLFDDLEHRNGFPVSQNELNQFLAGNAFYPLKIYEDAKKNSEVSLNIAKQKLISGDILSGKRYILFALEHEKSSEAFELLGNHFLDFNQPEPALKAYENALCFEGQSKWLTFNMEKSLQAFWHEQKRILLDNFTADYDRSILSDKMVSLAQATYSWYFKIFTHNEKAVQKRITEQNILIIGDYHVNQCIRYRIDQKVEQLERQGVHVVTQNWTELGQRPEKLAEADIVIFYRTPAVLEVIKAIAHAHSLGKITLFEIDDMLFETDYPAPIETYGGGVGVDTYQGLIESMALTRAAASLCQYGIASTRSLQELLSGLVQKKACLLHRNGLDKYSIIPKKRSDPKGKINIFYGSGTLAHNSDFVIEALPAIIRILETYPNVNLMVVGHLVLPSSILEKYPSRIKQYPKTKELKRYWELLQQATINIATLHDDKLNGAKSEIKWLEAGYLHVPSVVSATDNYRDMIRQGENGLIASNEQEWFDALQRLVEDSDLRDKIAQLAHTDAVTRYSVDYLGAQLAEEIGQIVNVHNAVIPKRKKIALVNVYFPPQTIGGATRVVSDNFDILCEKYKDEYDIVVFTTEESCVEPYKVDMYNYKGVTVYKCSILWRENMDWHPKDPNMYDIFQKFLSMEKPDMVHFHCVQRMTASVVEAALDMGVPYVVTVHDAWWISDYQFLVDAKGKVYPNGHLDSNEKRLLPDNVSRKESRAREVYLKHLLNSAEKSLLVSESFAKIYRKNGINNVTVTRNGLSTSVSWQPKQTTYTEKVVCALIGGLSAHKGYKLLQDAIVQFQPEHIELLLVDLSKAPDYEVCSDWNGVPVRFIGKQTSKTIVQLYQQIDVLLAPSIWPESFGLVTREAAACGCWVVASSLGGMGEDVVEGETGFVIEPTVENLVDVLKIINTTPNQFKRATGVSKASLRKVSDQVDELVGIFDTVLVSHYAA